MKNYLKLFTLISAALFLGFFTLFSHRADVCAQTSDLLTQISKYKSWTKLTKEPIKLEVSALSGGG